MTRGNCVVLRAHLWQRIIIYTFLPLPKYKDKDLRCQVLFDILQTNTRTWSKIYAKYQLLKKTMNNE